MAISVIAQLKIIDICHYARRIGFIFKCVKLPCKSRTVFKPCEWIKICQLFQLPLIFLFYRHNIIYMMKRQYDITVKLLLVNAHNLHLKETLPGCIRHTLVSVNNPALFWQLLQQALPLHHPQKFLAVCRSYIFVAVQSDYLRITASYFLQHLRYLCRICNRWHCQRFHKVILKPHMVYRCIITAEHLQKTSLKVRLHCALRLSML